MSGGASWKGQATNVDAGRMGVWHTIVTDVAPNPKIDIGGKNVTSGGGESENTVMDLGFAGWLSAPYKNVTFCDRILLPGIHLTRSQVTNTREEVGYLL